jgi:hypothetical protein
MEGGEKLLGWGLDGDWPYLIVAAGFKDSAGVGAVGLVTEHIGPDVLRREEDGTMAELFDLPRIEMRGSTGLHDDGGTRKRGDKLQELPAPDSRSLGDHSRSVGDSYLEKVLCQVNGHESIV